MLTVFSQVNIGLVDANPSSTAGAITILQAFQAYQPVKEETICPLCIYGDGLSCERHCDAQLAVSNGETATDRLEGLNPCAQEFHKRMLRLQVRIF